MNKIQTNTISAKSTGEEIEELAESASQLIIAIAFLSNSTVIEKLMNTDKKITLVVSLRPPTNYYLLKNMLHKKNVNILFLGESFHSKIYGFKDTNGILQSAILGSSNFTDGGLFKNIETNLITKDKDILSQLDSNLERILNMANNLQPDILNQYKKRYDEFIKYTENDKKFKKQKTTPKTKKIIKKSQDYLNFWNIADKIKDIVENTSKQEYPSTPQYLVIDHFWHWIVKINGEQKTRKSIKGGSNKDEKIKQLFIQYCKWDKSSNDSFTIEMGETSKKIQEILTAPQLSKLSEDSALIVYRSLHATQMLTQRFNRDKDFIKKNKIEEIRTSFSHLLNESLPIDIRIHDLIHSKSNYKLEGFGSSCVQELIGWANPDTMPIRNNKADKAVDFLGF